jgi:hypothetical protein
MRAATAAQVLFVLLEPLYAVLMPLTRTLNLALEVQAADEEVTQALLVGAARAEGDATVDVKHYTMAWGVCCVRAVHRASIGRNAIA